MKHTDRFLILSLALWVSACSDASGSSQVVQPVAKSTPGPVVFLGDSITELCPWDEYVPDAINSGVSGEHTGQMLARFYTDVLAYRPSVLVLLGGTNDIRQLDSADASNIYAMAQIAKEAGIKVIVGTLPPADINLGHYIEVERMLFPVYNDKIVKGAAQYGYAVVDYHAALSLPDGSINESLYADKWLHPNKAGCAAMFQQLEPVLNEVRT
jgi:lysophospholipase L1-like esterase